MPKFALLLFPLLLLACQKTTVTPPPPPRPLAPGVPEIGALPAALIGGPLVGLGVTALGVGPRFEFQKSHLDCKRGYPMDTLKVKIRLIWPVGGGIKEEKEGYRVLDLASAARPMSATDAADPAKVRHEMMRALALKIREDMGDKTGWGQPEKD